jgi:hypothetical protein
VKNLFSLLEKPKHENLSCSVIRTIPDGFSIIPPRKNISPLETSGEIESGASSSLH